MTASTDTLARQLRQDLQLPPQVVERSALLLGGDYAAGRRRRCWAGNAHRGVRIRRVCRRRRRIRELRAIAGAAVSRLAATGLVPAATHAAEVYGINDMELKRIRRLTADTMKPSAQGRSLQALRLVVGDPTAQVALAPALRWSREVWHASVGRAGAMPLPRLRRMWTDARPAAARCWADVSGPMSAAIQAARRAGWKYKGAIRNGQSVWL